ncbi:MAG: VOC family protein [Gemmatimonadales bacterium]
MTAGAPWLMCIRQNDVEVFLTEHPVTEAGAVVYFMTRDVDAMVRAAGQAGVTPTFGPENQSWGNREAYFRDRDGNTLRFGEVRPR